MNEDQSVRSVLIVGGGTAGWMTAVYLNRFLKRTGITVSLVESATIPTIGVGEATVPAMVKFLRDLKLDEHEFMVQSHATYKLAIKFVGWIHEDHEFWHPFGPCGGVIDGVDLFHYWVKGVRTGRITQPYHSYSLQAQLILTGRAPKPIGGTSSVMETGAYAYHLDASAFAEYLKAVAKREGVTYIVDDVRDVVLDENGLIDRVETEGGRTLAADLFIDCTGFRARLIEQTLRDPWMDWSHLLLCDRAVAMPLPVDPAMETYTRSEAMSSGWMWRIPLSHRVGCGYVYSSNHISEEAAARELVAKGDPLGNRLAEPRFLKIKVGRRTNTWVANCISIGLSSGFLEPIESTGILLIQRAVELLMQHFPDRKFDTSLRNIYNRRIVELYEGVRDFIILHYVLNQRNKDAFWRDSRNVPLPSTLEEGIQLYEENGSIDPRLTSVFSETSFHFILAGGERLPRRAPTRADLSDFAAVVQILEAIRDQNQSWIKTSPTHRDLIAWMHRISSESHSAI